MKENLKRAYMKTAETFAELSHARRLKVGCIIIKDNRIISIGYNGMPAGWDNNCEDEIVETYAGLEGAIQNINLKTKPEVLHAESNAIAKLARSNESGEGATLFVTHSPCLECAKLIYQTGIKKVLYGCLYRDSAGLNFLQRSGLELEQLPHPN